MDFSGKLFHRLVDYVTVHNDDRVVFTFATGRKLARRFEGGTQVSGNLEYLAHCFCVWKFAKN